MQHVMTKEQYEREISASNHNNDSELFNIQSLNNILITQTGNWCSFDYLPGMIGANINIDGTIYRIANFIINDDNIGWYAVLIELPLNRLTCEFIDAIIRQLSATVDKDCYFKIYQKHLDEMEIENERNRSGSIF